MAARREPRGRGRVARSLQTRAHSPRGTRLCDHTVRYLHTSWPMADDVARGGIGSLRAPCTPLAANA
eukprot:5994127-Prymnesium_polylepis.1